MPFFSIVVPTRDRADLCINALRSIQAQSFDNVEIVVVDDGSRPDEARKLLAFKESLNNDPKQWVWHQLPRHDSGHGVAFVRNLGIHHSSGRYVGMLDDDDIWIDCDFLKKAAQAIEHSAGADLILANQEAVQGDTRKPGPIWIESLKGIIDRRGGAITAAGYYKVELSDLLNVNGFCHLNTTIAKSALLDSVGGFDPCLRYESDRDLYLKLIDEADTIVHLPDTVARHHIPDAAKGSNVSTRVDSLNKRLFQVRILQNAALNSKHLALRRNARHELANVYKHISEIKKQDGDMSAAAWFARQGLATKFTLKWAAYTVALSLRAFL